MRVGPDETTIVTIYPGLGIETVTCTVHIRGDRVIGTEIDRHG